MRNQLARVALRTSLFYCLVAGLWILLSDKLLAVVVPDPAARELLQTYKGWAFVVVTSVLLYIALRGQLGTWEPEATARQQAEQAPRASEERLRAVTGTARVGLVVVDKEHRYRYANPAYADIFSLPTDQLVGQCVADVLAPVYEGQIRPRLDRAFGGERVNYELLLPARTAGDEERHYIIGTIGMSRYKPGRPYSAGDQAFLQDLADRAGLAIENLRLVSVLRGA
jgi:PAS domain S-box-containing protein